MVWETYMESLGWWRMTDGSKNKNQPFRAIHVLDEQKQNIKVDLFFWPYFWHNEMSKSYMTIIIHSLQSTQRAEDYYPNDISKPLMSGIMIIQIWDHQGQRSSMTLWLTAGEYVLKLPASNLRPNTNIRLGDGQTSHEILFLIM